MAIIPEPFVRSNYRGLNDAEDDLLRKYLMETDGEVQSLETNINLGPGESLPEFQDDRLREGWQKASQLKADALVERPGEFEVVELKDFIRTSHLGQTLSYRYWLSVERDLDKPLRAVATAPDLNPSAVQPAKFHGVTLVPLSSQGRVRFERGETAAPPFGVD